MYDPGEKEGLWENGKTSQTVFNNTQDRNTHQSPPFPSSVQHGSGMVGLLHAMEEVGVDGNSEQEEPAGI